MDKIQETYTIPDAIKGDTFIGVNFILSVSGSPSDLTGAIIRMKLKIDKKADTPEALLLGTTPNTGITITNATAGEFKIDEQKIDIEARTYFYDIEIVYPTTKVKTYIEGTWKIKQDITD